MASFQQPRGRNRDQAQKPEERRSVKRLIHGRTVGRKGFGG
jgi:hypothetical protein